jgi:hypothetical protein
MLVFSMALTSAVAVWMVIDPQRRAWLLLVLFPLIAQWQTWSHRRAVATGGASLASAEYQAWQRGDVSGFARGMRPSPWLEASVLLGHGRHEQAHRVLAAAFADPAPARWASPTAAPLAVMEQLVALLGDPLPHGNPRCEIETASALVLLGDYPRAAAYAAECYGHQPSMAAAFLVARSAAALGDRATAVGWLRAARSRGDLPDGWMRLAEFAGYRDDPEFGQLAST